jgi:hypothetical protein
MAAFDQGLIYSPGFTAAQRTQFQQLDDVVIYVSEIGSLEPITGTFAQLALPVPAASNLNVAYNNLTNLGEFFLPNIGRYVIDSTLNFLVSGQQNPANANRMSVNLQLRAYDSSGSLIAARDTIQPIVNGPVAPATNKYTVQGIVYTYITTTPNCRVALWVASENAQGLTITTAPGENNVSIIAITYTGAQNIALPAAGGGAAPALAIIPPVQVRGRYNRV